MPRIVDITQVIKEHRQRDLSDLSYIVLHHTASSTTQIPEQIQYRDLKSGKSYSAPYHYLVYRDGRIYKSRPISESGTCVEKMNSKVICVAGVGNWDESDLTTPVFVESVAKLCAVLLYHYPKLEIVPHKYLVATDCPGRFFPFQKILKRVEQYMDFVAMLKG